MIRDGNATRRAELSVELDLSWVSCLSSVLFTPTRRLLRRDREGREVEVGRVLSRRDRPRFLGCRRVGRRGRGAWSFEGTGRKESIKRRAVR